MTRRPLCLSQKLTPYSSSEVAAHLRRQVLDEREMVAIELVVDVVHARGDRAAATLPTAPSRPCTASAVRSRRSASRARTPGPGAPPRRSRRRPGTRCADTEGRHGCATAVCAAGTRRSCSPSRARSPQPNSAVSDDDTGRPRAPPAPAARCRRRRSRRSGTRRRARRASPPRCAPHRTAAGNALGKLLLALQLPRRLRKTKSWTALRK